MDSCQLMCAFSLHQFLLFWKGNEVEVVWADKQPFIATSDSVEASYYDKEFGPIKFKGKKKNRSLRQIYIWSQEILVTFKTKLPNF